MKDAKATFKYGVEFNDFNRIGSRWLHSFDDMLPHQCFSRPITENGKELYTKELTSIDYFLNHYKKDAGWFNRTHGPQEYLIENRLSPYNRRNEVNISQYPGYSYHINAFEFGNSLRDHTSKDRYIEIQKKVVEVFYNDNGIDYLLLEDGSKMYSDIFVDCTGFKKLLIGKLTEWNRYDLINNAAIWGPINDVHSDNPTTQVFARESGWTWAIPTWDRIGTGYVYSEEFISEDKATTDTIEFWKNRGHKWEPTNSIKFNAGRCKSPTIKNVVGNGLAQSFLEPLEATSIMVTCVTVKTLSELLNKHKDNEWTAKTAEIHSRIMIQFIDHTKKFVQYHYKISERDDTPYWREVANKPNAVQELCDYIDVLSKGKWLSKGETLLNQWNWTSMMLGFEKKYMNQIPDIESSRIDEYVHYTDLLIKNYEFIVGKNIPLKEMLKRIHDPT
jgi:tryptophan halogenase